MDNVFKLDFNFKITFCKLQYNFKKHSLIPKGCYYLRKLDVSKFKTLKG